MSFTRDWLEANPLDHSKFKDQPGAVRAHKIDLSDRLKDFFYGFISGETYGGVKKAVFYAQGTAPTTIANTIIGFGSDVSAKCEFFLLDEDGNFTQVTSAGKLLMSLLNLTDTPAAFTGKAGQALLVNTTEDAMAFAAGFSDAITRGFELTYKTAADLYVEPGTLFNGITKINKTARTTLALATAADWWDGAADSYAGGAGWCYIGVNPSGDIKLLGANPPDKADTAGNTVGTLYYWYDGSVYWRVIGAVWVHTDNTMTKKWFQQKDTIYYDAPQQVSTSTSASWTAVDCSPAIPAISTSGYFGAHTYNLTNGMHIQIRRTGSTGGTANGNNIAGVTINNATGVSIGGGKWCATDGSQSIDVKHSSAASSGSVFVDGYILNIR